MRRTLFGKSPELERLAPPRASIRDALSFDVTDQQASADMTLAERRVDSVIASATTAIARSRRSTIILAFSVATAILLGAVAAWAAACAGGRHRDGETLPAWMLHSRGLDRRRTAVLP